MVKKLFPVVDTFVLTKKWLNRDRPTVQFILLSNDLVYGLNKKKRMCLYIVNVTN